MKTLYIDTSSSYLYTGVVNDNKLVCEVKKDLGTDLSEKALPLIVDMLNNCSISPKEIEKIIVVNGPGSFTGIRVGLTIAKVYAWTLNIPITTITSLEAMKTSCEINTLLVPVINARRGFVYSAVYKNDEILLKPQHIELNKLTEFLSDKGEYTFITNDEMDLNNKKCSYDPNILLIVKRYCQKDNINPHLVNPEYLKLTAAEEARKSD